jgi:hypothetical protein
MEYAILLILISIFSIIWGLYYIRKNERALKKKIHTGDRVTVLRKIDNNTGKYLFLNL